MSNKKFVRAVEDRHQYSKQPHSHKRTVAEIITELAEMQTTMESGRFEKDHLLDQIIGQARSWCERNEEAAD